MRAARAALLTGLSACAPKAGPPAPAAPLKAPFIATLSTDTRTAALRVDDLPGEHQFRVQLDLDVEAPGRQGLDLAPGSWSNDGCWVVYEDAERLFAGGPRRPAAVRVTTTNAAGERATTPILTVEQFRGGLVILSVDLDEDGRAELRRGLDHL